MKIATSSWHYRFNRFNNENFEARFQRGRYTTCSYIRTTLASILASIFKGFIILFFAAVILGVAASMLAVPVIIFMGMTPYEMPMMTCVVGWAFAIAALTILFIAQVKEWLESIEFRDSKPKKEPNVFVQAIIDKHNKFCTLVTAAD